MEYLSSAPFDQNCSERMQGSEALPCDLLDICIGEKNDDYTFMHLDE